MSGQSHAQGSIYSSHPDTLTLSLGYNPNYVHDISNDLSPASFLQGQKTQQSYKDGQSSISMILFSGAIIAILLITITRLIANRLDSMTSKDLHRANSTRHNNMTEGNRGHRSDDVSLVDRRTWSKLNREERTRRLILKHGGKNMSKAIGSFVNELLEQKQLLLDKCYIESHHKDQVEDEISCNCSCHNLVNDSYREQANSIPVIVDDL